MRFIQTQLRQREVPKELNHSGLQSQWQLLLIAHWTFFLSDQQLYVDLSPTTRKLRVSELGVNYLPLCELTLANVLQSQSMIQYLKKKQKKRGLS